MRVVLALMEGVLDTLVRELLCEINDYENDYDFCITKFAGSGGLLRKNPSTNFSLNCTEIA
ncbi:MAG: tRNA-dihydrouridine(16) synthase [Sodalis sp.]|uniref:hypothetical protein n=1 Tax=Sodalis sp. (in: enterobacteria) TaxID=1898979 RepID=UPI003873A46F|nr:MAG: tRNA-dihydrouridine(16) synthase [Sodalis sp.]